MRRVVLGLGLIPAGAGNILSTRLPRLGRRAHPRRCGEHSTAPSVSVTERWLIPAGAGNIQLSKEQVESGRAHPRRCGEHPYVGMGHRLYEGSSPQVRGTSTTSAALAMFEGLIPAGAGNIGQMISQLNRFRAHPRRCGEHQHRYDEAAPTRGSSPQVRGTYFQGLHINLREGLIPAGAGNM